MYYPLNVRVAVAQTGRALPLHGRCPRFESERPHMGLDEYKSDNTESGEFHGNQHTDGKYTRNQLKSIIEEKHENRNELLSVRELCSMKGTPSAAVFTDNRKYKDLVAESEVDLEEDQKQDVVQTQEPSIEYRSVNEAFDNLGNHIKGDLSEMVVKTRLMCCGIEVHSLDSDNCRYDLLAVTQDNIHKIQVKTGNYMKDEGVVKFRLNSVSHTSNGHKVKPYTEGEIDIIAIYSPTQDSVYIIEHNKVSSQKTKRLRVEKPEMQNKNIDFAKDFKLSNNLSVFK